MVIALTAERNYRKNNLKLNQRIKCRTERTGIISNQKTKYEIMIFSEMRLLKDIFI